MVEGDTIKRRQKKFKIETTKQTALGKRQTAKTRKPKLRGL
jgi:hypothetical protein